MIILYFTNHLNKRIARHPKQAKNKIITSYFDIYNVNNMNKYKLFNKEYGRQTVQFQ